MRRRRRFTLAEPLLRRLGSSFSTYTHNTVSSDGLEQASSLAPGPARARETEHQAMNPAFAVRTQALVGDDFGTGMQIDLQTAARRYVSECVEITGVTRLVGVTVELGDGAKSTDSPTALRVTQMGSDKRMRFLHQVSPAPPLRQSYVIRRP